MKYINYYDFRICNLGIVEEDVPSSGSGASSGSGVSSGYGASSRSGAICCVFFNNEAQINNPEDFHVRETPLIKKAAAQLDEYFNGKRKEFNLPLALHGTDFQNRVWEALQNIPYGETVSYSQIAAATGNLRARRAVGMANNRNPIPIIIPCHRVIGKDGNLTGYAGGLDLKQKLLLLEKGAYPC
jgi:methylated-DNA-[protein]-cysteine S-methyltransferase